ncbi:MAG: FG-GAP repeat protein [Alphaproteobacteria bacterium]|nr:FG-GAP repeat protein [Alphaproteobacteria bacterium]
MARSSLLLPLALGLAACKTGSIKVGDGDGDGGDGGAATCPNLAVDTSEVDFGAMAYGEAVTRTIVVQNDCAGSGDLDVLAALSGDPLFTGGLAPVTLSPGDSATFDVTFTADDYDAHTGTLQISSNDTTDGDRTIALSAQAIADADGDGQDAEAAGGTDCDDTDPDIYQRDTEAARDLVDDDCDGLVDEDFIAVGDVYVSEVQTDPLAVGDGYGEWFEVHNDSGGTVDLVGWKVTGDDDDGFVVDGSLLVEDGDVVVFGVSGDLGYNGGVDVDYEYARDDLALADTADSIFLYAGDRAISDLGWSSGWPLQAGASLSLDPFYGPSDDIGSPARWCASKTSYGDGDKGTPGSPNELCSSVDHDGDGYSADDGDCADADSSISPGADEQWDGIDNNCDGQVDIAGTDDATSWISGNSPQYLSGEDALGAGDLDGDGVPDLIVGSLQAGGTYSNNGGVGVIDGTGWQSWSDDWDELATMTVDGTGTYNRMAYLSPSMGDHDGDGIADLVIGGSDAYSGGSYGDAYSVALYFGGPDIAGGHRASDADVLFTGTFNYSYYLRVLSDVDVDGDGLSEVVYGNWSATRDRDTYKGVVSVVAGDNMTADIDPLDLDADADLRFWGEQTYDILGHSLGGGDADGDGYDELYVGAPGYSTATARSNGRIYRIEGGTSTLGGEGSVGLVADTVFSGKSRGDQLGWRAGPVLADFDGDGRTDLALSAPAAGEVYVLHDASRWTGEPDLADADAVVSGAAQDYLGMSLAAGDANGDGQADLAVGAPDTNYYNYATYYADEPGAVYVFSGRVLAGDVSADEAGFVVQGTGTTGLGWGVLMVDFDGDDGDELVVGDPGYAGGAGRVWVFNP